MDNQTLINGLFSVVGFGVAWWVKSIWAMVQSLQSQVVALNVELAKNYVPRAELQETFNRIFQKLDEILESKADKR
jgi:hypothetical protein